MSGRRLRRAGRRLVLAVPGSGRAVAVVRGRRAVRGLLDGGRFDVDWYAAQADTSFSSPEDAARDYLERGRRAGLSPNSLFEPEWYDPAGALTRPDDPFGAYLARIGELRTVGPHVLVDPATVIAAHPEAATHRHGPLGYVLDHADAEGLAPAGGGPAGAVVPSVPWVKARGRLIRAVTQWRQQERLRRAPRRSAVFDHRAEKAWRSALRSQPAPVAEDAAHPVVTVVMPVRNRSGLMRRAVDSVRAQKLPDWELVVVDDGSTDDTPYVLEGLAAADPRIRVFRQDGSGVSRARNRGIAEARGEYLAFLDSDNTWLPDFLDLAVRAMRRDDVAVAYAAMQLREGDRVGYRAFDGDREYLLVGNHIDLNVLVARTELVRAVGGFAEDLRRAVDYDLVLRLTAQVPAVFLPFVGAVYSDDSGDRSRISVSEPLAWDFVVRSRHAVDWAAIAEQDRVPGRVSVVVPVRDDLATAARCVAALLASEPDADLEVVVADLGSRRAASVGLAALELRHPRLQVHRLPVDTGPALGVNLVLPHATGEVVAVCDPRVVVDGGWLAPLLAALERPGAVAVQPLVTDPVGTVAAAGATFTAAPGQPVPLLWGHPVEDALKLGDVAQLPAVDGPFWLCRAADLVAVRGLDPLMPLRWLGTDVSLRLAAGSKDLDPRFPGRLVTAVQVELTSADAEADETADDKGQAVGGGGAVSGIGADDGQFRRRWCGGGLPSGRSLWRSAGFAVTGHRARSAGSVAAGDPALTAVVARGWRAGRDEVEVGMSPDERPLLRWRIRGTPELSGRAQAVAAALRRWEQDAVVDLSGRPAAQGELDDVTLHLVGAGEPVPEPAGDTPSLLWLLDPGQETAALVAPARQAGYAHVLWTGAPEDGQGTAGGSGTDSAPEVCALAPAIDPVLFRPATADDVTGGVLVAVDLDDASPLLRAAVHAAVRAGADIEVRGRGWAAFLPPGAEVGEPVRSHRLAAAYAGARAVLLDAAGPGGASLPAAGVLPWSALQAAACAAPVLLAWPEPSPQTPAGAPGAWSLVRTFTTPQEAVELIATPSQELSGDPQTRLRVARDLSVSDSYDARAFTLVQLAAVLTRREVTASGSRAG